MKHIAAQAEFSSFLASLPKQEQVKASAKPAQVQDHVTAWFNQWFIQLKGEWKPEQVKP
jgi:hypothetical protein